MYLRRGCGMLIGWGLTLNWIKKMVITVGCAYSEAYPKNESNYHQADNDS